ncbi:hypothetical protein Tco_1051502 [Tanacetum coccineum]
MAENDNIPLSNGELKRITDYLTKSSQIISDKRHFVKHPRYVKLLTQDMFDNLVELYAIYFITEWQHYSVSVESFPPPTGIPQHIYIARCYISMWFINLYVSNRKIVTGLHCHDPFNDCYQRELCQVAFEFDHYLALLNASIRPTYIENDLDNALYIPVIADSLNVNEKDPFGISNFTFDLSLFFNVTYIMKEKSHWRFTKLSTDPMGRPCWLFDWHTRNRVCSWFSEKGNYTLEDVTLAYILGTACTSNLGSRDVDDWQFFAEGVVPSNPDRLEYDRVVERRFHGSYEVRTMDIEAEYSLSAALAPASCSRTSTTAKRSKRLTETEVILASGETLNEMGDVLLNRSLEGAKKVDQLMPRFRLMDWVYYCLVIWNMDKHVRVRALGTLLLDDSRYLE